MKLGGLPCVFRCLNLCTSRTNTDKDKITVIAQAINLKPMSPSCDSSSRHSKLQQDFSILKDLQSWIKKTIYN